MTKRTKILTLFAFGMSVSIGVFALFVSTQLGPRNSERQQPLTAQDAEAASDSTPIESVSLGITEDTLKGLRPNIRLEAGIDANRRQALKKPEGMGRVTYEEYNGVDATDSSFLAKYSFEKKRLTTFQLSWKISKNEMRSVFPKVLNDARVRYGKEDEHLFRDLKGGRASGPAKPCPQWVWRKDSLSVAVGATLVPQGPCYISVAAQQDPFPPESSIFPVLQLTDVEKGQFLDALGLPMQ